MSKIVSGNLFAVVPFVMLLGLGCSQSGSGPATYPVTGTVTYNGQPVEGATVAFQAADGSHGAVGVAGADGKFEVATSAAGGGLIPGEYKVTISKYKTDSAPAQDIDGMHASPEDVGQMAVESQNSLPARYADAAESGFAATVKEDGENDFTFNMTD